MNRFRRILPPFGGLLLLLFFTAAGYADMVDANDPGGAAAFVYGASPSGAQVPYRYQYFPDQEVYFDPVRELYFYRADGGEWIKSPALPSYLRGRLGDFVVLRMNVKEPYRMHAEVIAQYPARSTVSQYPPGSTVIVEQPPAAPPASTPQPPPWRPTGAGPVYHYMYYPASFVYYDVDRGVYFYESSGRWVESASLPAYLGENLGNAVSLQMNTDTPFIYHAEVTRSFPHPGSEVNKTRYKIIRE